ncbi:hypothetical protein I601_1615 [Nocardioides dokdonensis FR1436]|uniref:Iron-containing redox enzyme n=1 Tax=Nocardioides dokdonensis FR1436 TaxID=1300347 RepID=A0A1A9GIA5_9ACTN|nr:iron-containing redox enzyme family protein [Nocardioides dokdonensis]ANH38047.1 hypothetical protein I601_1615 [Nocardioides dokdonensis FR1436]
MATLPRARGPLSDAIVEDLRGGAPVPAPHLLPEAGPLGSGDEELALWVLHELHHRGFDDVPDDAEWRPDLLAVRAGLEQRLEQRWRAHVAAADLPALPVGAEGPELARAFFALCDTDTGSESVARFLQREADEDQLHEVLRQRSIYHVKEQDAAMWTLPRLPDTTKAHLMTIAYDEYGNGRPEDLHAALWARGMSACGLDASYGAHVDDALPEVLEQNNLMSLLGLQRRLVPAALGHLAAFEVTSAVPSRRVVRGLERLGAPEPMVAYYREHMVADAVHEQVAVRDLLGSYVAEVPGSEPEIAFGAAVSMLAEAATATALLAHVRRAQDRGDEVDVA